MNYLDLRESISSAQEKIESLLRNSIIKKDDLTGSGQLIHEDGKADHVGVYGTSAIFESINIEKSNFESCLKIVEQLESPDPEDDHSMRDAEVVFKLCAAINGLKVIHKTQSTDESRKLLKKLVNKLIGIRRDCSSNGDLQYWPFTASQHQSLDYRKWVLPSAYALGALSGTNTSQDDIDGVVKFLAKSLKKHLSSEEVLHNYELVHVLLALNSQPNLRREHLSKNEIEKAEYGLYVEFVYSDEYSEKFINFVTLSPFFSSLFYVIKTDLTIIKYFLLFDSNYIHSADVFNKIQALVKEIIDQGKLISSSNNQVSVRVNALVYRVLMILSNGLAENKPRYKIIRGAKLYNQYIRWSPNTNLFVLFKRIIALLFISSPIAYIIYSSIEKGKFIDEGIPLFVAISTSVFASIIYERLRRN
jgi:hypothetical protein